MLTNTSIFRVGFQAVKGIDTFYYASPNPLPGFVEGFHADGTTPLKPAGSFAFRLLSLAPDTGTDFLGNPYRSVAVHSEARTPVGGNTNSGYWLSAPQPSRFAVVSHYSDLRTFPVTPQYGDINFVLDPSFEYDRVGSPPFWWGPFEPEGGEPPEETPPLEKLGPGEFRQRLAARLTFGEHPAIHAALTVIDSLETPFGDNCLEVVTHAHPESEFYEPEGAFTGAFQVATAKTITFSCVLRCKGPGFKVLLKLGHGAVGEAVEEVEVTNEWTRFSVTLEPKASGTTFAAVVVPRPEKLTGSPARTFYLDAAQINRGTKALPYFDGDSQSAKWEGIKGRSASIELVEPELEDSSVVIDSIVLNPITPGIAFNVYYTNDLTGSEKPGEMTEEEWEQKLWVRVPKSFITAVKTTYVLPEPITAKFIKIEFSHLQPRTYDPGNYQKPTQYRLFPDWVATPFLAEVAAPSFAAKRVGVIYDALELAYQPLLTDLLQGPITPEHPAPKANVEGPAANRVDPSTLNRINLVINTYLRPPAFRPKTFSLLGEKAAANASNQVSYPVEGTPAFEGQLNLGVSGLDRQVIITDQSFPVMFFWVTCRHEYKELSGVLESNRAYFAGIKELSFLRNNYGKTSDIPMYTESGGDDENTDHNDFVIEREEWFAY